MSEPEPAHRPSGDLAVQVEVTSHPLSIEAEDGAAGPSDGAVVVFAGVVRDNSQGRQVTALEYEAYEKMAVDRMMQIGGEAVARWKAGSVRLKHRTGRLEVGEVSVIVTVTAPHRREAFEACKFCIDAVKESAPIWKKENFEDGSSGWVAGST